MIPFLKWAGGKRWLTSSHSTLFPQSFNRYIEPFLGSGAVFFHIQPKKALLADSNAELIEAYQAIKDDWHRVVRELRKHHKLHCKSYYYQIRDSLFRTPYSRAAKLIYLNRTCWNGLYRVNLKGEFNVPIGTKTEVIYDTDNFEAIARLLQHTALMHGDFEQIINQATTGDFVFIDPPYTVQHNLNNFIKYNEHLFHWGDQVRLRNCVYRAKVRGAQVIVTNAYHKSVKELYKDIGRLYRVKRHSVLAADASKRKVCDELLIVI